MLSGTEQTLSASGANAHRVAELRTSLTGVPRGQRGKATIANTCCQPLTAISQRFFNQALVAMPLPTDLFCIKFDQPIVFWRGSYVSGQDSRSGYLYSSVAAYDLWFSFAWQDIRIRYRRSKIGPLWITIIKSKICYFYVATFLIGLGLYFYFLINLAYLIMLSLQVYVS